MSISPVKEHFAATIVQLHPPSSALKLPIPWPLQQKLQCSRSPKREANYTE